MGDPEERATKLGTADGGVRWTSASAIFACSPHPDGGGDLYWVSFDGGGSWTKMFPV